MQEDIAELARKARSEGLDGDFTAAHALLDKAEVLAGEEPQHAAVCQIERGRLYNSAGSPAQALPFFVRAWDLAREAQAHALAVDAAHMLAIASPLDDAVRWTATALDYIAAFPVAAYWRAPLHNNMGWTYFDHGRYDEAMASFQIALEIHQASGNPAAIRVARYAIVRTLRALGRNDEALSLAEEVASEADARGENAPYVFEELAELYALGGDESRSALFATRALAILGNDRSFVAGEPQRLERLKELGSKFGPSPR
jgi:tetratricopeptide (TPR) repeat protein